MSFARIFGELFVTCADLLHAAMKRCILSLLALCAALTAWGQPNFLNSGKTLSDVCSVKDRALVTAEGDFNKDGLNDLVIAIPDENDNLNFAFYLGEAGGYTLFRSYGIYFPADLGLSVTDKGVVRIQCNRDGGFDAFLFRYEKGDFRLIGGKKDRHQGEHYDESYNYLTGKMIRTEGEGKGRKSVNRDLPALPVINFGWIPLNYNLLDYLAVEPEDETRDEDDILVMGIFRRMQDEEMLFWHFCDWENPSRDPARGENEDGEKIWGAEDSYESPGSYNAYSSLTFKKIGNRQYFITLETTSYDRSYESLFDEELSNVDEIMEEYATEEETLEEEWTFYNGLFTVG